MGVFLKNEKVTAGQQRPLMSLRSLFGILFFLLMIGTILLSYLINMLLLESYYLTDRKKSLVRVYNELQSASVSELLTTDDFDYSLRESLREGNMSLLVMDSGTRTIKVWSADESLMEERLYSNIFGMTPIMNSDSPEGQMPPDEDSQEQQDSGLL